LSTPDECDGVAGILGDRADDDTRLWRQHLTFASVSVAHFSGLEARDEEPDIVSGRDDLYPIYRDGAYRTESNQQARQANEARMVDNAPEARG